MLKKNVVYCILLWLHSTCYAVNPSVATISATIPAFVRVSSVSDIILSPITFDSPIIGNTSVCIYSNTITPLGSYYVTAISANASGGSFRISNGASFIEYSAYWNTTSAPSQTTALVSGTKTGQLLGASGTSLNCGGSNNANFNIQISTAQISGKPPATYTDVVTLLISPT